MRRLMTGGVAAVALLVTTPAFAQSRDGVSAADLRRGLSGEWTGALVYRDYQSDARFEIPVDTTIEVLPDGATTIRRSLFNDGPGRPVWITSVSLVDEAGRVQSASYRKGRDVEIIEESITVSRAVAAEDWTLVYSSVAEDNDAPAEIRVTETRDGDQYVATKDVRPVGGGDADWVFRNETRLTRRGD